MRPTFWAKAIVSHQQRVREWPPEFPRPKTTILGRAHNDPQSPREKWGEAEWRAYALFLEERGGQVMRDLIKTKDQLRTAFEKLRRGKRRPTWPTVLGTPHKSRKRGRPPGGGMDKWADEVLLIRDEMKARGLKATDALALEEWYVKNGQRRSRARGSMSIFNAMSKRRKFHKNSGR